MYYIIHTLHNCSYKQLKESDITNQLTKLLSLKTELYIHKWN